MAVKMNIGVTGDGELHVLDHLPGVHLNGQEPLYPLGKSQQGFLGKGEKGDRPEETDFESGGSGQTDGGFGDASRGAKGCNDQTIAIINTAKPKTELKINLPVANVHTIDATTIALAEIGKNIVNTVILGAFAKDSGLISLDSLKKAIKQKFSEKGDDIINKNIRAIEKSYNTALQFYKNVFEA